MLRELPHLLAAMRPRQWLKNGLVLAGPHRREKVR